MPKQTFFNLSGKKQKQIINAAIIEFSQSSFEEVKISNIINIARIPRSSFYDYFEDKRDLYKYIILFIKAEKMKTMGPVLEKNLDGFFETFRAIFKAGATFASIHPEYEKLSRKMYENINLVKEILEVEDLDVASFYESMIINGIQSGELRKDIDVKFVAKSIDILSFQLTEKGFKNRKEPIDEFIESMTDKMIDFLKYGISN